MAMLYLWQMDGWCLVALVYSRHCCLLVPLVPSYSSPQLLGPTFLWRSCSSKSWFCLLRHSTAATRVYTCLSRTVTCDSLLLLVAIKRVSTIQLFVWEVVIWLVFSLSPKTTPIDDVKNHQWAAQSSWALDKTCETKIKKTLERVFPCREDLY